jgi:uncharacterized damage-inducible protein DinB
LRRFKSIDTFKNLSDTIFDEEYDFNKIFFENINEYISERIKYDKIILDFVNELSEFDFNRKMKWTRRNGTEYNHTLGTGLIHLSHHQTHHRGMISLYLEFIKKRK